MSGTSPWGLLDREMTTIRSSVMKSTTNEQVIVKGEHVVAAKERYEAPELTLMGKVEHLTALGQNGPDDLIVLFGKQ